MMEELFAVVDKDDQVVGKAYRSEVHGNPALIHRVAHVLVFNNQGKLYLQKRSLKKVVQPGKWDTSVGGHVDFGETYQEAALRETGEELGFHPDKIEFLYKYLHVNQYESEYVSTFYCSWNGPVVINPDEISEGRFWELDEIRAMTNKEQFTPNFLDELDRHQQFMKQNQRLKN